MHVTCHATAISLVERKFVQELVQEMACRPLAAHRLMEKMTILMDVAWGKRGAGRKFFQVYTRDIEACDLR